MSLMDWLREQAGLTDPGQSVPDDAAAADASPASDGGHLEMLGMVEQQFAAEIASGNMTPARQQMLTAVLRDLRRTLERPGGDVDDLVRKDSEIRALLARMTGAVGEPTRPTDSPGPRPDTRAATLQALVRQMEARVLAEHQRPHPADGERDALQNLHLRCIEAKNAVHALAGADAITLEQELLRPLALDVRRYALRNHITVAQPIWPSQPIPQSPNTVHFGGRASTGATVRTACEQLGMELPAAGRGRDAALRSWDRLRACHVAVFDLSPDADDAGGAHTRASVCYELGIALALGRAVVVLAGKDADPPFDVDVEPVRLFDDAADVGRIADAIDRAMFGQDRGGADSSLDETIAHVRTGGSLPESPFVGQALTMLEGEAGRDPVRAAQLLEHAFGFAGAEAPRILHPAFPGDYPAADHAVLFHVMPFGPDWASAAMASTRAACDGGGVQYVRGDQVLDPDIIRSIWDHLCTATHVLVDLTGLNPNVALELGIAHVLGRNVMVVTQDLSELSAVPVLARLRAHTYAGATQGGGGLVELVRRFVS